MVAIDVNTIVVIVLIAYFFVCVLKKISFKIMLIIGIVILGIAGGFLLFGQADFANTIATIAYYVLIVAAALAIIEYLRDLKFEDVVITCPDCGTEVQPGFKFCPECGKTVPVPQKTIGGDKEKNPMP